MPMDHGDGSGYAYNATITFPDRGWQVVVSAVSEDGRDAHFSAGILGFRDMLGYQLWYTGSQDGTVETHLHKLQATQQLLAV